MEREKQKITLNKLTLQIIAMVTMLIDHIGVALLPNVFALRYIGRLAFPIFAYFIAEGFARTHSFRKYLLRMTLFALLAEIPFDLMNAGKLWVPFYQNVLWTFCIALLCLRGLAYFKEKCENLTLRIVLMFLVCLAGYTAGFLLHVDYSGWGVLLVIGFSLCRELSGYHRYGGELLCMVVFDLIGFGGIEAFSMLSLPLLWLYNGKPGKQSRPIRYACYAFYPVHLLILGLLAHLPR